MWELSRYPRSPSSFRWKVNACEMALYVLSANFLNKNIKVLLRECQDWRKLPRKKKEEDRKNI
jgi:hypothetical protein